MTRELNVRITLSEDNDHISDLQYETLIWDSIVRHTDNYQVCVEVHTVTPESANPKDGDCKYHQESGGCKFVEDSTYCPYLENKMAHKCKYYEPKR